MIDAALGVLGLELQEAERTRILVLDLVREFGHEEHFLIFTPEQVEIRDLIRKLHAYLSTSRLPLKMASINVLHQMVGAKRRAHKVTD